MEKEINLFLNSFFCQHYEKNNLLLDNIKIFLNICYFLDDELFNYLNEFELNFSKITKNSFLENIELIKKFYQENNIDFDVDKTINLGTIESFTTDTNSVIKNGYFNVLFEGINYMEDNHKSIFLYNNGLITDSIVLVHELSHLRNQFSDRNQISNLLTESIAFAEQLIYIDYLKKYGYEYESEKFKLLELNNFYSLLYKAFPILGLYLVYEKTAVVSKENYKLIFGNSDNYTYCTKKFMEIISNNKNEFFHICQYLLASLLSIYMYISYKDNKDFMKKIKLLNDNLNEFSLEKCLNTIGLECIDNNFFTKNNKEKIKLSFDKLKLEFDKSVKREV